MQPQASPAFLYGILYALDYESVDIPPVPSLGDSW